VNLVIVVSDASIKNNIATSIAYIHSYFNPVKKTLHQAINITTTEVELSVIRCEISQAIQISDISYIIIITDSIHTAQRIFDSNIHLYQLQSITISKDLRSYFNKHSNNSIKFWDCPSNEKWPLHTLVDKDTKEFNITPYILAKSHRISARKKNATTL